MKKLLKKKSIIIGLVRYGFLNANGGTGVSYAEINRAFIYSGNNSTSGTALIRVIGGNKQYSSTSGTSLQSIASKSVVMYISKDDTLNVGTTTCTASGNCYRLP